MSPHSTQLSVVVNIISTQTCPNSHFLTSLRTFASKPSQMKTTIQSSKSVDSTSLSFSKRFFHLKRRGGDEEDEEVGLTSFTSLQLCEEYDHNSLAVVLPASGKKKFSAFKFRSMFTIFGNHRSHLSPGLGSKVVGTLFGYRQANVHFAFQEDPKSYPAFFIELSTPTSSLVREMASGLVRIALECDKKEKKGKKGLKLLEEPLWRTYCNGNKCGLATRRESGPEELRVLKAVEPVTMGAGVLPGNGVKGEGELMYMRAKFERVVGSKNSEAFYMLNPDGVGGPELSMYLLRV